MTRLLVSVRSAEEVLSALAGGADLIDVKEPRRGSLGPALPHIWAQIAAAIAGVRPLSAALGELLDFFPPEAKSLQGYTFAKLGLAGCAQIPDWPGRWQSALASLPRWIKPVAVAYADYSAARSPSPREVCEVGQRLGCRALLIDTFDKTSGSVFDVLPSAELGNLLDGARRHGMTTVLAGSLRLEQLPQALSLQPDYLAVRGAVCRQSRASDLDEALVKRWSAELSVAVSIPLAG